MYQKITTLTITAIFALVSIAAINVIENDNNATEWELDEAHSAINFSINHFFTPVNGTFDQHSATLYFDPENLEGSKIDVSIPVASVNTRNDRRDNHLKTDDFFNAEKWPEIRFVSNRIVANGDNNFVAHGELTIRDVTKNIELPFELLGLMDHPMQEGKQVAGITAKTELMRNDFGVGTGDWRATAVVGNKVNIELNLELVSK